MFFASLLAERKSAHTDVLPVLRSV